MQKLAHECYEIIRKMLAAVRYVLNQKIVSPSLSLFFFCRGKGAATRGLENSITDFGLLFSD